MNDNSDSWVTYEHPLNERMRTLLRLEFLIETAGTAMQRRDSIDSRTAVEAFIHTLQLLDRGEVRSEVIKELDRLSSNLSRLSSTGGAPEQGTSADVDECRRLLRRVGEPDAALGGVLREDELLALISQRFGVGAGTCSFDLPSYHRWLSRPYEQRLADMQRWYDSFADLRAAVLFALRVQREAQPFSSEIAEKGAWQRRTPYDEAQIQMLRLRVTCSDTVIPEISGNRHLITIRFLRQPDTMTRPQAVHDNINFQLALCSL
ncbi:cell division protein ZapD [Halorhodospira halochloris]|uniref:Cell division protein ZapD n=1 Tax=Halorhodospira halochloris TaxID=1052 RepID=A0A0X8XAE3_HALHR|nr:cell division protein ZapD [Halorhodospira halochloris]MBK1652142.1 hypothetical protein [Halorhodospira halochloris]MCG5530570.1 cell division protein ZapD [Halorhodospira halochloris]MCG5547848.1 cell division protein ZapD [Halorhodospira halochloris]BAU58440.1 hypothetical protein HH1059_17280 [Halorhodospira halochloris]